MPHLLRAASAGALDPVDRATEVIFGLLMAMTFVGTIAVAEGGRQELRTLLVAALGCNIAWGIADAVMYLVCLAAEERRSRALLQRLHDRADVETGRQIVAEGLTSDFAAALDENDLDALRLRLLDAPRPAAVARLGPANYRAALGVFLLVVLATFPVALPYLFIDHVMAALRLSQAIAIVLLFVSGAALARYSGGNVVGTGSVVAAIGVLLLIVLIALGG